MIAIAAATVATLAWIVVWGWAFYSEVQKDGSWYNSLKEDGRDTFTNRLSVTLTDRIRVIPTVAQLLIVAVVVWAVVYIFTVGLLEVVG